MGENPLFVGIYKEAFKVSSSSPLEAPNSVKAASGAISGAKNAAIDGISGLVSKIPMVGDKLGEMSKVGMSNIETKNMADTIKSFDFGEGFGAVPVSFIYIPGFLEGQDKSYKEISDTIARMTWPKKVSFGSTNVGEGFGVTGKMFDSVVNAGFSAASSIASLSPIALQLPVSNHYYTMLDGKSFLLDSYKNSLIHVTLGRFFSRGGLFCTEASIDYSYEVDDKGQPLYAEISLTLTPYRGNFSDEVAPMYL